MAPLGLSFTLALVSGVLASAPASAQMMRRMTCQGEIHSGANMAGTAIGNDCLVPAQTPEQETVNRACSENTRCAVTGLAERQSNKWVLRKVLSADALTAANDPFEAIRQRNRAQHDAEMKQRAALDSLGSSGADVVRRSQEINAQQNDSIEAALAEARKPAAMLLTAYRNYLATRMCFESRSGYAEVYLYPPQMDEAKRQVRGIEAALLAKEPSLDKDERWAAANREELAANKDVEQLVYTGRGQVVNHAFNPQGQQFCTLAAGWLQGTYAELDPGSGVVRKDF